ncbi:GH-E family nuclease [Nocardia sp. NPDC057668]|uniref:WXG100-like domain-containing protein n=1 Tax=Nocardia sp. NPDC057668 TaxID=3346202 RepID=UPI00366F22D8
MALEFPSWLEWLEWVVGSDWPHGNEDLMWQMGRDLQTVADEADFLLGDIDKLLGDVRKAYPEGTGGEQILTWLQPLRDGTGPEKNGSVQELAEHYQQLATSADAMGDQLQSAKLNFYIAGGWLVAELAWAAFGGPFAPALHAAALATGRVVFRALGGAFLKRILANIARRITSPLLRRISPKLIYEIVQESLEETLQGTSQELLVQYIQKKSGHIDEYNWDAVKDNAKISAIAGAAGGAAGFGGSKLFPTNMGGFKGAFNGALTGAGAGAVGAGAAWLGGGLVTGELGEFDPRSLTGGALSGAGPSAIHGARGLSPDAGPVRAPGTDPTTTPSTNTPGTTPGTNPSSTSPAGTNGANSPGSGQNGANNNGANQNGANQNGANSNGANQNGATNGEDGGSNQPANSGDTNGKGSDTSGANQQGGESPSNNGESAPSNGKESGDTDGRGDGPDADTNDDGAVPSNDSNTESDSTTASDSKADSTTATDGKPDTATATDGQTDADTRSETKGETRSEADTKADQTGRALNDISSQPDTTTSPDTAATTNQHATATTNTTANVSPNTTAPNTTAPNTSAPSTATSTTSTTTTPTSSNSATAPNSADTRAANPGDPARSAPAPRADVAGPRAVDAPATTTRASIGDATFAHPGAGISIQAAQTGVEATSKPDQHTEHQGPQLNPDTEQAVPVPVPVPVLPVGVDPTRSNDPGTRNEDQREMAQNYKSNSRMPGGQISFGELSPKAKQLVNALAQNEHIPIRAGEVSVSHLAELQQFSGVEHAIVQNRNGDLRLFRGKETTSSIPLDLRGEYMFVVHTHPEDRTPGPPSEAERRLGHNTDSMWKDLDNKRSPHTEVVVSRDGQVRFFNNEGLLDVPPGQVPAGGPINDRGYVVPVQNLGGPNTDSPSTRNMSEGPNPNQNPDSDPENHRDISQDPEPEPPERDPEQDPPIQEPDSSDRPEQSPAQSQPKQAQPEQEPAQPEQRTAEDQAGDVPVATELDPPASDLERNIESEYGIPVENQRKIQGYADEHNLQMFVRPTNPDAVPHLKNGAMPKPMSVKDKTINDLDIELGAPSDAKGLVGRFAPGQLSMPDTTGRTEQEIADLQKRLADREKDFHAYREYMQGYLDAGKFQVRDDGVLEALVDGEAVPVTGDHDLFDIRHGDGTRLTPEELAAHEDRLKDLGAGIMHGPHVYWNPDTEFQRQRNFEPIVDNHQENPGNPKAEPLIRFEPNQEPAVVWADKDLAAIDREMTPWHLETDLRKLQQHSLDALDRQQSPAQPQTAVPDTDADQPNETSTTDPRQRVEQDIDRLRDLARDLANHPDFDHDAYRAWLNDELTTPTETGTPAHKIATIKLEALAGTDPAEILGKVEALDHPAPQQDTVTGPAQPAPPDTTGADPDAKDDGEQGDDTPPDSGAEPVGPEGPENGPNQPAANETADQEPADTTTATTSGIDTTTEQPAAPEPDFGPDDSTPDQDTNPDQPQQLTPHLSARFEQVRALATDIATAMRDPGRATEVPVKQRQLTDLLTQLGLDTQDPSGTPWNLLNQHQPALALYLDQNLDTLAPRSALPTTTSGTPDATSPLPQQSPDQQTTTEPATTGTAHSGPTPTTPIPDNTAPPASDPIGDTEIESKYGIPVENQGKIQRYANGHNLRFDVRPTNPDAVRHLKNGAMPKPMSIKDKTINDLDIKLGARAEDKGLVGRFAPGTLAMPDTTGMTEQEIAALAKRLADREGDYGKYQKNMRKYIEEGKFQVNEHGVLEALVDGVPVPVTGDHDLFDLRHADGTRLSPAELAFHEKELSKLDAGIMHGPHVYWNPEPDQRIRNFEPIIKDHRFDPGNPDAEPLIRFEPHQDPRVTWSDRDVHAIDRDMTPWHLESDLAGIDPTRSETAPADIDELRRLANDLAAAPDFDHPAYRSLLEGNPATPDVEGSPAHKMATIALEARNGTDPADIVRMVQDLDPAIRTTQEPDAFHGEPTDAGHSFHTDPDYADLAHRVPNDPDYTTVDAHIDQAGNIRIGDRVMTPEQFADLLRESGWDGRTPIRLIGCDAATNGFATRLAQALGVDVLAPTAPAWTDPDGNVYTSSAEIGPDGQRRPRIPPDGEWQTHHPDGTSTRAGEDGFVPGTRDEAEQHLDPEGARDRGDDPDAGNPQPPTEAEKKQRRDALPSQYYLYRGIEARLRAGEDGPPLRWDPAADNGKGDWVEREGTLVPTPDTPDHLTPVEKFLRYIYEGARPSFSASTKYAVYRNTEMNEDGTYKCAVSGGDIPVVTDANGKPQFFEMVNGQRAATTPPDWFTNSTDPSDPPHQKFTIPEPKVAHMGHMEGYEYWRQRMYALYHTSTIEQFERVYDDPGHYRLELKEENEAHGHESNEPGYGKYPALYEKLFPDDELDGIPMAPANEDDIVKGTPKPGDPRQ